ncbi:MAG: response regulator, partial [Candidatus Methanoperedens sp.]|nr:response regulator [Candidatus Methanoperedens sp.]
MKILIVDDNKNERIMLSKLFVSNKYEVSSAENGSVALEKVKESKPDVIISDVMMPVMDGFTFLRELKKDQDTKDIPLVFYTATYVGDKDKELAEAMGALKIITKPVEPKELLHEIQILGQELSTGVLKPTRPLIESEEEYLKKYTQRLFHKLQDKILELEQEIIMRKQTESALIESENRYRTIFENAGNPTVIIEEDMTISMVNKEFEKQSGYSRNEVEGKRSWTEFMTKEDWEKIPEHYECEFIARNGMKKDYIVNITMIPGTKKSVASLLDITERKKAEELRIQKERAEFINKAKAEFLSTMSHELKTPLNAIIGFSEIMQQGIAG